jgi:hypothetical protein
MPKDPVLNTWIEERLAHKVDFKEGPGPTSEQVTAMLDSAFTQALEKWGN